MSDLRIEGEPTKTLFIDILTRDIPLIPSIVDLVDNSSDGARAMRGNSSYEGLWVRLTVSSDEFRVSDNCGGITINQARNYAFRFGRANDMPHVKHSVGEFGVGMKRAIFKMGVEFKVESATASSRFVVEEDVRKWAKRKDWNFSFSELKERTKVNADEQGTTITVKSLREDVAEKFGLENFLNDLKRELKIRLQESLAKGLAVTLNGVPVDFEPGELLGGAELAPAFVTLRYPDKGRMPVGVKLYCGLSRVSKGALAGWYVYCNGRLILEADKSETTGWGKEMGEKSSLPSFHGQYNLFRGYAYFDSDHLGRLPWNTTKTDLNTDSPVYKSAKLEMVRLMRPVIDFLNKLKEEKTLAGEDEEVGPLQLLIDDAKFEVVTSFKKKRAFSMPVVETKKRKAAPKMQRVQYEVNKEKYQEVKRALQAKTAKAVGEKTFDYYYNSEVD